MTAKEQDERKDSGEGSGPMPTRRCICQVAGAYLPPDIFRRYRLRGNTSDDSGSDTHGTPITITAEREGITPGEVVERFHRS